MATTDLRNSSTAMPGSPNKQAITIQKQVDFSSNNGDDGDLFTVMNLFAGQIAAFVVVPTTAEGATATIEMKTTETTAQTILSAADINATTPLIGDGADGDAAMKWFYIVEDTTVQIETNNDSTDTAVLDVKAYILDTPVDVD